MSDIGIYESLLFFFFLFDTDTRHLCSYGRYGTDERPTAHLASLLSDAVSPVVSIPRASFDNVYYQAHFPDASL